MSKSDPDPEVLPACSVCGAPAAGADAISVDRTGRCAGCIDATRHQGRLERVRRGAR